MNLYHDTDSSEGTNCSFLCLRVRQSYGHRSWKLLGKILVMSGFELILDKVKILVVNELNEPLRCCNSFFFFFFLLETNCIFYGKIVF